MSHPAVEVVVMVTVLPTCRVASTVPVGAEMSTRPAVTLTALAVCATSSRTTVALIVVGLVGLKVVGVVVLVVVVAVVLVVVGMVVLVVVGMVVLVVLGVVVLVVVGVVDPLT